MKIIIKGNGIVGKSTKKFLDFIGIAGHDIEFCDPPKNIVVKDYDKVDYVVICVPTPLDKDTGINDGSEILNAVSIPNIIIIASVLLSNLYVALFASTAKYKFVA